ncbi:hypothetical protein SteCoe_14290 [Stentor coeruleus]|uniref:Uncharacterized protein n=1 Tax=Stentor coeruleus TaxID=5963 RepID=A0A1R2C6A5_9CILI|nr:hypothetical protein SteCoe_14290 [Stentor coeruleus]
MIENEDEDNILRAFLDKKHKEGSAEFLVYKLLMNYKQKSTNLPFAYSLRTIKNNLGDFETESLQSQCRRYVEEIQEISKKLAAADEIVRETLSQNAKFKQLLLKTRIENSNLILINRKIKSQLIEKSEKSTGNIKNSNEQLISQNKYSDFIDNSDGEFSFEDNFTSIRKICLKPKELQIQRVKSMEIKLKPTVYMKNDMKTKNKTQTHEKKPKKYNKTDFLLVETQGGIGVRVKKLEKKKSQREKLGFSRNYSISVYPEEKVLHFFRDRLISIEGKHEKIKEVESFTQMSPKKVRDKMRIFTEGLFCKPVLGRNCENNLKKVRMRIRKQEEVKVFPRRRRMKCQIFKGFSIEKGRTQIEMPDSISSTEENEIDEYFIRYRPILMMSKTIKSAFVPKIKKLLIKSQGQIAVNPGKKLIKPVKNRFSITKTVKLQFSATKPRLGLQNFPLSQIFYPQKPNLMTFTIINNIKKLNISKGRDICIIQLEEVLDTASVTSTKSRKTRRTVKRASAIEEYFTLTFQVVKLNFSEIDKISMIKCADLYAKVQQAKIPYNLWHDWIKEQFHFIANRS